MLCVWELCSGVLAARELCVHVKRCPCVLFIPPRPVRVLLWLHPLPELMGTRREAWTEDLSLMQDPRTWGAARAVHGQIPTRRYPELRRAWSRCCRQAKGWGFPSQLIQSQHRWPSLFPSSLPRCLLPFPPSLLCPGACQDGAVRALSRCRSISPSLFSPPLPWGRRQPRALDLQHVPRGDRRRRGRHRLPPAQPPHRPGPLPDQTQRYRARGAAAPHMG